METDDVKSEVRGQGGPGGEERAREGQRKRDTTKESAHGNSVTKKQKRNSTTTNHGRTKTKDNGNSLMEKERK